MTREASEEVPVELLKALDVHERHKPDLARFLDSNRIMNYLNGEPWYDVHPLLLDEIRHPDQADDDPS
jgi:hypothetical protein